MSEAIDVFPTGPIRIGRMAIANLIGVRSSSATGAVARYGLEPIDREEYEERSFAVQGALGLRYAPIPGLWVTMREISPPAGDGGRGRSRQVPRKFHELWFGAEPNWLHSQSSAMGVLGISRHSLLAPFVVRTLALGYVHRVGF